MSENQTLVWISDISQKCLKSKLFGNKTVVECLKSILDQISDTHSSFNKQSIIYQIHIDEAWANSAFCFFVIRFVAKLNLWSLYPEMNQNV